MGRLLLLVCCTILVFLPYEVGAIEDNFTIRLEISGDSTPPTIPAPVTATPVATTQIDVTWGASTDDTSLGGYYLFRNGIQIAVTTNLTFSDVGLTPSTTYSYYVQAFDFVNNISTSSATVATTTLPVAAVDPAPTTTPGVTYTDGGYAGPPAVSDFSITTATNAATLWWNTNTYTRYKVRWGKTLNYELGVSLGEYYTRNQQAQISGLEPGTSYYYELISISALNREVVIKTGEFTTKFDASSQLATNVLSFQAIANLNGSRLSWQNLNPADFSKVRIMRSNYGFPSDPTAGAIVYEGRAETLFDTTAFTAGPIAYYTLFVYGPAGAISSGAVVAVARPYQVASTFTNDNTAPAVTNIGQPILPDATSGVVPFQPWIQSVLFSEVIFFQHDTLVPLVEGRITADSTGSLLIQLPAQKLPQNPKYISLKIFNDTVAYGYLLRYDQEKRVYQARLTPPLAGFYQMNLEVKGLSDTIQQSSALLEIIDVEREVVDESIEVFGWYGLIIFLGTSGLFLLLIFLRRFIS